MIKTRGGYSFFFLIGLLCVLLSSCFLQNKAVQAFFIRLLSNPYTNVVIRVNGVSYSTNNQVSINGNTTVALQTDSQHYFDKNQHVLGNDTLLTFERWSTGATSTTISVIITEAATYTAYFAVDFKVVAQIQAGSQREQIPISGFYASGTALEVEAPPVPGKVFSHWLANGANVGSENPLTVTVNGPKMMEAVYTANQLPPTTFNLFAPTDGATQVDNLPWVQLLWTASADPQGGPIRYDVFLGESEDSLEKIAENIGETYWFATTLDASKTYYWYVKAKNNLALETSTAINDFTTIVYPPTVPLPVFPQNGQDDAPYLTTLIWECTGASEYDLYYGTSEEASQLIAGITTKQYRLPQLTVGAEYFWKIVARNALGNTEGPWWHFTVSDEAIPPSSPHTPEPQSGAIDQDFQFMITWEPPLTGTQPFLYDVYFGPAAGHDQTSRQMEKIEADLEATGVELADLAQNKTYIWQVVAKNPWGVSSSAVWSFTTKEGIPNPTIPTNPIPADGAINIPLSAVLSWTPSTNGTITYDVYFGTDATPVTKIATAITTPICTPTGLVAATTYYWKVVAKNEVGERESAIWSFATAADDVLISLQKITNGFLIRSNRYFSPALLVIIQLQSNTIQAPQLTPIPDPFIKMTPEGENTTFFIYGDGTTDFQHFSPTNLVLATVTCTGQGTICLSEFFNDALALPVDPTPLVFP
ncbi:MAG TPA: fibronectin type III domain-containing protein [Thermotogota bacterium]|nr:fibronectin type III domain-containing protein [Thermotogota bacterium]